MNEPPRIIELVGPPGSGKSTLARALDECARYVIIADNPDFRRIGYVPFFVKNVLMVLPMALRFLSRNSGRGITSRDIALMAILGGWHEVLSRQVQEPDTTVVLDEGAICLLARLQRFSADPANSPGIEKWWSDIYEQWAGTLDVIIQLHTPVPELLKRIRNRKEQYEVKAMSDEDALQYLSSIQVSQDHVLDALVTRTQRSSIVLSFDTVEKTPQQLCNEVLSALGLESGEQSLIRQ